MNREVLVYPKWLLRSKTFIFNAASFILLVLPFVSHALSEIANLPEMSAYSKTLLGIVNVVNIVLRLRTYHPASLTRNGDPVMVEQKVSR